MYGIPDSVKPVSYTHLFSILTEDNNRFEKVEDILADIRVGMNKGNPDAKFVEIPDRLDALHYAVDHAQEGDQMCIRDRALSAHRAGTHRPAAAPHPGGHPAHA